MKPRAKKYRIRQGGSLCANPDTVAAIVAKRTEAEAEASVPEKAPVRQAAAVLREAAGTLPPPTRSEVEAVQDVEEETVPSVSERVEETVAVTSQTPHTEKPPQSEPVRPTPRFINKAILDDSTAPDQSIEAPIKDSYTLPPVEPTKPEPLTPDAETLLTPREEIDSIKTENLTGRQLRVARRMAQKHGLTASSDLDAVRLLRRKGLDPFQRNDMLQIATNNRTDGRPSSLPTAIRHTPTSNVEVITEDVRASEVQKIQTALAKRRRRRLSMLLAKLAFFVLLPTAVAGFYYFSVATSMFSTKSEFVIQQSEGMGSSGLGGLFAGTSFATTTDSIAVQSYLNSREAMMRLDEDYGFKSHFQQPEIDSIQRLAPDSSNEAAYRVYQKRVKIGYDPTEGIIKMEVVAATPEASATFSKALIRYAEEQVDNLTHRLRDDQMDGARASYDEAELKMIESQRRVLDLQEARGVLSADLEISSRMAQINSFEIELKNRQLELAELKDNPRPNATKLDLAEKAIERIKTLIADMRSELTNNQSDGASLARVSGELVIAEADLQTRQVMLSQSLQQLETARIEANRQTRYLSLGVSPIPPDEATYPRAFENTVLAFLIFAAIYLMASLTTSILREQVIG